MDKSWIEAFIGVSGRPPGRSDLPFCDMMLWKLIAKDVAWKRCGSKKELNVAVRKVVASINPANGFASINPTNGFASINPAVPTSNLNADSY